MSLFSSVPFSNETAYRSDFSPKLIERPQRKSNYQVSTIFNIQNAFAGDDMYNQMENFRLKISSKYPSIKKYLVQPLDQKVIENACMDGLKTTYRSHYSAAGDADAENRGETCQLPSGWRTPYTTQQASYRPPTVWGTNVVPPAPVKPKNNLENNQPGRCEIPRDEPPRLVAHPTNEKRPVGILVDPQLVGDVPRDSTEKLRFYPCKVQERDLSGNWSKIQPQCPFETTYQSDFTYRGKDPRRCRTYEFRTGRERCEVFFCSPIPPVPPANYGRKKSDLKPVSKQTDNYGVDVMDAKNRISEYMGSVSKLGEEIIGYNLFVKAAERADKARRGVQAIRGQL